MAMAMVDAYVAGRALVSEADAASRLRELRVFSVARRERVGAAVSQALSQWQRAWDWRGARAEAESLQVQVFDALDPACAGAWSQPWQVCEFGDHGAGLPGLRWRVDDDGAAARGFPLERFAAYLWSTADERQLPEPAPAPGSLAAEMALAMWQDFWQRWAVVCTSRQAGAAVPAEIKVRATDWSRPKEFSGVLLVGFQATGLQWTVALEAEHVDAMLVNAGEEKPGIAPKPVKQAGLVRVDAALGQRTLALDAYLRPCTLSLGALQNLRVGDVIALEHPLDQPSQLFSESREKVAHAWMTQTNGFKSLELAGT